MTCNSTSPNSIHRFRSLETDLILKHNGYYKYTNAVFTTMLAKFQVTCPVHGDFLIAPAKHLSGQGCARCNNTRRTLTRRSNTNEFVTKAQQVAPQYTYEKVQYTLANAKVAVTCPTHGDFAITPNKLLAGRGCPTCANIRTSAALIKPVDKFVESIAAKYGDIYTVVRDSYRNCKAPVALICSHHGKFVNTPDRLLNKKNTGCPQCIKEKQQILRSSTTEAFVSKATTIHKGYYSYKHVNYVNNTTPVWITCPTHGEFSQTPAAHLAHKGCLICNLTWKYSNIPTTLYYIQITTPSGDTAFKIGITTKTLKIRYYKELSLGYTVKVLSIYEFLSGETAFLYEQSLLKQYQHLRYSSNTKFLYKGAGDSELFHSDILSEKAYNEVSAVSTTQTL